MLEVALLESASVRVRLGISHLRYRAASSCKYQNMEQLVIQHLTTVTYTNVSYINKLQVYS